MKGMLTTVTVLPVMYLKQQNSIKGAQFVKHNTTNHTIIY